jgi:hypothetical protein
VTVFPFELPLPTMWYVVLLLVTMLLHVAFMAYVLAGSMMLGIAGFRGMLGRAPKHSAWQGVTRVLKDWMPFALSAAITAGIAPLLFVQILYQQEFYTANLLSFHRWMAIVPVLIIAFYLLYLLKAHRIEGRLALQGAVAMVVMACVLFVGWSWIENHLLSLDRDAWPEQYRTGAMVYASPAIAPRLGFWIVSGFATASALLAWQLSLAASGVATEAAARAIRMLAIVGVVATPAAGLIALPALGFWSAEEGLRNGTAHLLVAAGAGAVAAAAGFALVLRPSTAPRTGLVVASAGLTLMWLGLLAAREFLRLESIGLESLSARHERVGTLSGLIVFLVFAVIGLASIAWIVRTVHRAQHGLGGKK